MKLFIFFLWCAFLITTSQSAKKLVTRESLDDSKNPMLWLMIKQVDRLEAKQVELQKLLNTKNTLIDSFIEKVGRLEPKLDNLQRDANSHKLEMETALTKLRNAVNAIETKLIQSSLFSNTNGSCEYGWKQFNGHCYYFEFTTVTWENAKNSCERKGGYLVKIDNKAENKWLAYNIPKRPGHLPRMIEMCFCEWRERLSRVEDHTEFPQSAYNVMWIGANDLDSEGRFTWVSDDTLLIFSKWHPGEPNNHDNEDCANIDSVGLWNDITCGVDRSYICEKSAFKIK